jgi:hypothetical protein
MINQNINSKIDQLTGDIPAIDESLPISEADSVFTGETEMVAGVGAIGKKIIEKATSGAIKKTLEREVKPTVVIEKIKPAGEQVKEMAIGAEKSGLGTKTEATKAGKIQQKINEEPQVTVEQLQETIDSTTPVLEKQNANVQKLEEDAANGVAGAKEELAQAKDELNTVKQPFNLPVLSQDVDLQSVVKSISEASNIKTENITFEDVVASAKSAGMDDTFISKLTEGTLTVNPKNTYMALEAQKSSALHLQDLMRRFKDNPESITPADELEAMQTISFHSLIQRSVKGYQTNVAQSLAVMRIPREGFVNLEEATSGLMSSSDLRKFADAFLSEADAAKRSKLIDATAIGGWKDKAFSVFVNNILSRPATHVKNAISNTLMMPIRLAEKAGAAGVGTARKAMGLGADEQYYFSEVFSSLSATTQAIKDGFNMAKFAAKEGYSSTMDDANKIGIAKARTEIFDYNADSPLAGFLKGINFVATLPGRSLLTADEFFKGVNYRFEMEAMATRNGIKAYDDAVKAGSSSADAESIYDKAVQNVYDNPPDELNALAQEATFTKPLEGWAKKAQELISDDSAMGFLARLQIPFVTTPVNLNLQVLERTPLAALGKKIRGDIAKGGKEGDMALAKIGMGTSAGMMMAGYAEEGKITGAGPADKGQRDALMRQGWQPYSLVFDFSDMTESQKGEFAKLPVDVRYGSGDYAGKVYVSYQGMEPIGAFMAMSANYHEYVKYENDNSKINAMRAGLAYGFYDYMMQSPFLQGLSNISSSLGMSYRSNQDDAVKLMDTLGQSLVNFAGRTVIPLSGLVTSVREKTDPYQREYKIDANAESSLPTGIRQGINDVLNTVPGLSNTLPLKLNLWGEPVEYEYAWAPIRMKEGKQTEADQIIIQTGAKVKMPARNLTEAVEKGLSVTVDLNPNEYNEMLLIANDPAGLNLQEGIVGYAEEIKDLPLYRQQSMINDYIQETFSKARKLLYTNSQYSEDIQARIQERADIIRDVGQGAK